MGGSVEPRSVDAGSVDAGWRPAAVALVAELERRGLVAEVAGRGGVRVRNPAGEPDPGDPRGQVFAPGMRQEVVCRRRDGAWWWLWAWADPSRVVAPDLEPLCPAAETERAAERIARVLAVPFAGSPAVPDACGSSASSGSSGSVGGGG